MKALLITLLVLAIAIFTGTWIFDALDWSFSALSNICEFLSKIFNFFGWNGGIL